MHTDHAICGGVNFHCFPPEALIPFAPYMQNPSSFRPQGAILRAPSHTKLGFAIPLYSRYIYFKVSEMLQNNFAHSKVGSVGS